MTQKQTNNTHKTNQTNRLSIQIALNGLSFLIISQDGTAVSFSEKKFDTNHTPEELLIELNNSFTTQVDLLQGPFKEVTVIYHHSTYALVPAALYDETKASEYLKFNTKILSNDFITHDAITHHGLLVVYVPYVNINNAIFDRFGSFKYYHSTSLLLKYLLNKEKHELDTKVYIHVSKEQLECIVISKGKLQLCNSFNYKTPEDFIYYILFCFEQLQLNPDTIQTILLGSIEKEDGIYEMLYTYIRNISFILSDFPKLQSQNKQDSYNSHQQFILKTSI